MGGKGFLEEVAFEQDTKDSELSNLQLPGDQEFRCLQRIPHTHIASDAPIVFISVCQTKALGSVGAHSLPAGQPSREGGRERTPSEAPALLFCLPPHLLL